MSVLFECPECKSRLFAEPKGSPGFIPYKCRIHTDTLMEQAEDFAGPNFQYLDEDEINPDKTGVQTFGTTASRITPAADFVEKLLDPEAAAAAELEHLRNQYTTVTNGKKPHSQWKGPRLRKEIEAEETRLNDRLEYFELVDTYTRLTDGDKPSDSWGLSTLRSRVTLLKRQQEEQTEDA